MADHDHHHHPDQSAPNIGDMIAQQVALNVQNALRSPQMQNEILGKVMQHLGSMLSGVASNYLSLSPSDVLVQPVQFEGSDDAVLLTHTLLKSNNCYSLLVNCTVKEDGERDITCTVFRGDEINTRNSDFITLPPAMQGEVLRQLAIACTATGHALLGMVIVKDYFKHTQQVPMPTAQTSAQDNLHTALEQAGVGLPEVQPLL